MRALSEQLWLVSLVLLAALIPAAAGLLSPVLYPEQAGTLWGEYVRELFGLLIIPIGLVLLLNFLHSLDKRRLGRPHGSGEPGPGGYETIVEKHARGLFY